MNLGERNISLAETAMNLGEGLNNARLEIEAIRTEYAYATGRTMTIARNSLIIAISFVCNLEISNILTILGDYYGCPDNIYFIICEYRKHILENFTDYSRLLMGDIGISNNNLVIFRSKFYEFLFERVISMEGDTIELYYLKQRDNFTKFNLDIVTKFYKALSERFIEDGIIKPGAMQDEAMNVRIVNGEWMRIKLPSDFSKIRGIYSGPGVEPTQSTTIRSLIENAEKLLEDRFLNLGSFNNN